MDALNRTIEQFQKLFGSMSPSQRMTLILLPVIVVGAFGFLMVGGRTSSYVAVSWGKAFTTPELINAEQALHEAGLTEYRREGQRLMVPKKDVERYNAALLEGGSLPTDWASELEAKLEESSPFTTGDQLQVMKDALLGKHLSRMLRAMPDIEDANVVWAPAKKRRWPNRASRVTATVNVLPRRGRELSATMVKSLRVAVAAAIPELNSSDVVVFDQRNQKAYEPDQDGDPYDSRLMARINEVTEMYHSRIADALGYIDDVLITVNVDLENIRSHITREQAVNKKESVELQISEQRRNIQSSQQQPGGVPGAESNAPRQLPSTALSQSSQTRDETNTSSIVAPSFTTTQKEYIPAMPRAVQVSVQIPEDYFQKALGQPSADGTDPSAGSGGAKTRDEIISSVQATVAKAIGSDTADQSVAVDSYVRVPREQPTIEPAWTDTVTTTAGRWAGAVGLAIFALWALRLLSKTTPKLPEVEEQPEPASLGIHPPEEEEQEETKAPEPTERDRLQGIVRDNPEMAATVLSKWIQSSR